MYHDHQGHLYNTTKPNENTRIGRVFHPCVVHKLRMLSVPTATPAPPIQYQFTENETYENTADQFQYPEGGIIAFITHNNNTVCVHV